MNLLAHQRQVKQANDVEIINALGEYRLITVTSKENASLKHEGWKDPVERYQNAEIEIGFVENFGFDGKSDWKPLPLRSVLFAGRS